MIKRADERFLKLCLLTLLFFVIGNAVSGCISIKLDDSGPLKASGLSFSSPSRPFILYKDMDADKSWQSNLTGNVIALFSDCSRSSDRPLNQAIDEIAKGFDRIENKKNNLLFYNGREAIYGEFKGYIDGIKVSMESLVFNKNKCFYQLTYSGVSSQFDKEKAFFEEFKKGFRAP